MPYSNEFIIIFESGKKLYLTANQGDNLETEAPEINWGQKTKIMEKKNKLICDFNCDIYGFRVIVSFQKNFSDLEKELQKRFPDDDGFYELEDTGEGRVIQYSNNIFLIWIRNDEPWIIVHEVFHCVQFMMEEIGCKLSEETKEPYAYLAEYLTKKIYELKK